MKAIMVSHWKYSDAHGPMNDEFREVTSLVIEKEESLVSITPLEDHLSVLTVKKSFLDSGHGHKELEVPDELIERILGVKQIRDQLRTLGL